MSASDVAHEAMVVLAVLSWLGNLAEAGLLFCHSFNINRNGIPVYNLISYDSEFALSN